MADVMCVHTYTHVYGCTLIYMLITSDVNDAELRFLVINAES